MIAIDPKFHYRHVFRCGGWALLRPLTCSELVAFSTAIKNAPADFSGLAECAAACAVAIVDASERLEGIGSDYATVLMAGLTRDELDSLVMAIFRGASLSEDDRKNSPTSSPS